MSTVDAELEIAETPVLSPGLELTEAREGRVGDITVHIEAIWVSGQVPRGRVALLRKRYPSVLVYGSKRVLLRRHRLSRLDSYRRLPYLEARLAGLRFRSGARTEPGPLAGAASSPPSSCCCAGDFCSS